MVKASPYIPSSNAGEFSPRMDARVDFEKYGAALSRGLNLICLPQGGVTFRPGSRFIKEAKASASMTALIPFEPVSSQAYVVETGEFYFRFFRNQGQITALATGTNMSGGWADRSTGGTATGIGAGGGAVLTGAGNGFAWAENGMGIPGLNANQNHVITFQLTGNPGSLATVQIGSASLGNDLFAARNMGMGWHTIGFNPGALAVVWLQFINENADTITVSGIRVLTNEPVELASPYPASVVQELRWAQSADVKYLFHDDYPPYKLERRGDTSWSLVKAFFSDGPYLGINPDTDLSQTQLIKNNLFSGGFAEWGNATTGVGFLVPNSGATTGVFFGSTTSDAGTANVSQAVFTGAVGKVHVLHWQNVGGGHVTASAGTAPGDGTFFASAPIAGWYSVEFTPTVSPFYVTFEGGVGDTAILSGVTGAYCYNTSARLLRPGGTTGSISVTALDDFKPFASTDVGRSIRFQYPGREPGWGIITAVASSQSVTVRLYRDLPSTAALESWRLGAWSDTTGWPHVGTFYQQRLVTARNASQPQTVWASQSGDFQNNRPDSWIAGAPSVQDTAALNFTLASGVAAPIVWLMGVRKLIVGTAIGQWALSSRGAALTPSDFAADPQTSVRARDLQPITIDSSGLFVQKAKRALYDIGYNFQIDNLKASDVTILSDHIARGSFAQIVYQAEPMSNIWSRLEDGTMTCLTYKRDQNVIGWTPTILAPTTAGAAVVESLASIPGNDDSGQVYSSINRDELWMVVRRTIGGVTKRYIEMMEGVFDGPNRASYTDKSVWRAAVKAAQVDAFYVDCGLTYKGSAATSITGLAHLNGETVKVVADGAVQADKVVSGGAITLDLPASTVHVGLPYNWIYRGMKLPYGSQTGAGVGQSKNINGAVLVLRDSASFDYCVDLAGEGDEEQAELTFSAVPFRRPADHMSSAYPLFSGEVRVDPPSGNGFSSDPRFVMRGTAPLPWTLLGIAPNISESEL